MSQLVDCEYCLLVNTVLRDGAAGAVDLLASESLAESLVLKLLPHVAGHEGSVKH